MHAYMMHTMSPIVIFHGDLCATSNDKWRQQCRRHNHQYNMDKSVYRDLTFYIVRNCTRRSQNAHRHSNLINW